MAKIYQQAPSLNGIDATDDALNPLLVQAEFDSTVDDLETIKEVLEVFSKGCTLLDIATGIEYRNEGTPAAPSFVSSFEISIDLPDDFSGSFQVFAGDLTLEGDAGGDGNFLAGMMGNIHGEDLTQAGNEMAGVIGAYSIMGTNASTYPKAGVIGDVGSDGPSTTADGAFVAVLNGGNSGIVTARAAYAVDNLNNDVSSKFQYGFDFQKATHDGYPAVSFSAADGKFQNGNTINNPSAGSIQLTGNLAQTPTAAALNSTGAITAAQMIKGLITSTSAAATALTTPTAAAILALIPAGARGSFFDLIIDNSAGANTVTLTLDGSITAPAGAITGGNTLAVTTTHKVGIFRFYFTGATTAVVYRIA